MVSDIFLIISAGLGCAFLFCRRQRSYDVMWVALPLLSGAAVWWQLISAGPVAQLAPALVSMMLLPGFIILELAFPLLSRQLNVLERPPLIFGLSVSLWTLVAAVAYRAHLSSDAVIMAVLVGNLVGLALVFWLRYGCSYSQRGSKEQCRSSNFERFYLGLLVIFLILAASMVAYRAQFQPGALDIYSHLVYFQKNACNPRIMGGNMFLGPTYPWLAHYVSNPWTLVGGLTARTANVNAAWLYVFLAGFLTIISFLTFYSLVKTLINDHRVALIGTLLAIWPWLYELNKRWKGIDTYYFDFLPQPNDVTSYILYPLLITFVLRFVRFRDFRLWSASALLAVGALGQHGSYIVWIPSILGAGLLVTFYFSESRLEKKRTLSLLLVIGFIALGLTYLYLSFPTAGFLEPLDNYLLWKNSGNIWHLTANLYCEKPVYLLKEGWKELLGLLFIALLIFRGFHEKGFKKFKSFFLPINSFSFPTKKTIIEFLKRRCGNSACALDDYF